MRSEIGFSLIELVVVIVILGTLSAIALPRLVNVSEDAHVATSKAEAVAFKNAVDLVHSTYQIRKTNPVIVAGASVLIDATSEWPTATGSGGALCINLWNSVLANAEPVTAVSNPFSVLSAGWNTFGLADFCSYGKKFGDRKFSSGDLPHFVYYIHDVSGYTFAGTTYIGKAGEIQKLNL